MPYNPDIIWVGTDIGIFESTDNGLSWHLANNGLPAVSVYQMKISGDQVVIATHGKGIWSVTIPELLNVPFLSNFNQVEALHLSLTANLNIVYDSVQVYIDNVIDTVVSGTGIGVNTIPVVVKSGGTYAAYIQGFSGGVGYKSNTIDITFTFSAFGIDEVSGSGKTDFYPNPASSYFGFSLDPKYRKYHLELYSLSGQKIITLDENNTGDNTVNVDSLKAGTYLVVLTFGDNRVSRKLVITR
jgi:hypothetical protein